MSPRRCAISHFTIKTYVSVVESRSTGWSSAFVASVCCKAPRARAVPRATVPIAASFLTRFAAAKWEIAMIQVPPECIAEEPREIRASNRFAN